MENPLRSTLRTLLASTVERLGYWISAIELANDHRGLIVRLFIDGPGGVGIADCAKVTREISPLLDVEDPIPDNYNLEVSSPGIDRLIERPEDFVRFAGFRAKVCQQVQSIFADTREQATAHRGGQGVSWYYEYTHLRALASHAMWSDLV